jgi:hypothetical protein
MSAQKPHDGHVERSAKSDLAFFSLGLIADKIC